MSSAPFSTLCSAPGYPENCFTGFISIDVQSGPSGENPTGPVTIHFGGSLGPTFAGTVSCLAVNGNQAVVGFAGTEFVNQLGGPVEQPFVAALRITDADSPGPFEDAVAFQTLTGPAPTDCPLIPPQLPPPSFVLTQYGTVVVHDAQPPAPTSKEQCKDGGWQQFGFQNQGQCVAFVNRGDRS